MLKRIVSWGVLFFSFSLILLTNTPKVNGWSWSFDSTYYVPLVGIPYLGYEIMAGISGVAALFFIISAFWGEWSDKVETFLIKYMSAVFFLVYWFAFIMSYLKGVKLLIPNTHQVWLVHTVFYVGYAIFLLLPVLYLKWFRENRRQPIVSK